MNQIGKFLLCNSVNQNLIIHITKKLFSEEPLQNLKQEELFILFKICKMIFTHGIEILILRENIYNLGVSDITILNRKVNIKFWFDVFTIIKKHSGDEIIQHMFNEQSAKYISHELYINGTVKKIIDEYFYNYLNIPIVFSESVLSDPNIIFSVGAVSNHRLVKLCSFFFTYWGIDDKEPIIRKICKYIWTFYIIAFNKISILPIAFTQQRPEHEVGIFKFIQNDFCIFFGLHQLKNYIDIKDIQLIIGEDFNKLVTYP
ncbi:hypothetical protein MRV_0070 [Murid herpesvirus 3]|uniref:Uncharacterized protein n=2 Tax=Murid betaherpesvirus 3 TaxID=2560603 RepID=A0A1P8VIV9_9BETA|nr:hypothetical protein MRV_0070 [Murine roseolovirus]APZ76281.1 hypothetical protein MRV_0070 [Murid betaherpesvirus 3]AYH64775.1 hypothetical protein MRV_0070 [Murid herpesvirus 3]